MATLKSVKKQVFNLWRKLLPSLHKVDFALYCISCLYKILRFMDFLYRIVRLRVPKTVYYDPVIVEHLEYRTKALFDIHIIVTESLERCI